MNILQSWLIVGVPALVAAGALFTGRSAIRALAGYVVLAATLVFFLLVPSDPISALLVGLVGVFLIAGGRGTLDEGAPEHHEDRDSLTTAPSHT